MDRLLSDRHVLLVDDDPKFRAFVQDGLSDCGATCTVAGDAAEALAVLADDTRRAPDIILLDIMMPEVSGWELLASMRDRGVVVPVIFVSAREAVEERVRGLRMGADDYIVKPFAFMELLARIEVVLRRYEGEGELSFGDLRLHLRRRLAHLHKRRIELSPREFDLLRILTEAKGRTLSRTELLHDLWDLDVDPGTNVVDVYIGRLRRKLDGLGDPLIRTVRGKGYALRCPEQQP